MKRPQLNGIAAYLSQRPARISIDIYFPSKAISGLYNNAWEGKALNQTFHLDSGIYFPHLANVA